MSGKTKGSNAERELLHRFWKKGYACIRIAGSGSMKYPSPDLLAANKIRRLAIEVKITKAKRKYFPAEEVFALKEFADAFGAEPWIAIRFFRTEWFFVSLEDMGKAENSYYVSEELARRKGLLLEELE